MFSRSQFQTLFTYHWHTNLRLMECAAKLGEADYKDNPGYGHDSIHDLLFHLLRTAHRCPWVGLMGVSCPCLANSKNILYSCLREEEKWKHQ
jgi:uncharacterized damage-inducible protein DinB